MKKLMLLLVIALTCGGYAYSQTSGSESMSGERSGYLPKTGDIGVGIAADPILDYIGNMFNGNTSNKSKDWWPKEQTVYLRYFLFDDQAVRLRLNVKSDTKSYNYEVQDDAAKLLNPLSNKTVEDKMVRYENKYTLAGGYQFFRGQGRLRGFYGGDFEYSYNKLSREFTYGNKMNAVNPTPTSTDKFDEATASSGPMGDRPLTVKGVSQHTLGLVAFTGAEFYFYKQACIGFEVGLKLKAEIANKGYTTHETMIGSTYNKLTQNTAQGRTTSGFTMGTSIPETYGNFYVVFHF